jgi:hypothetical protein
VTLEREPCPEIRVREKYGVRKVLGQPIGVRDGNHFVVDPIDDKGGLIDAVSTEKAISVELGNGDAVQTAACVSIESSRFRFHGATGKRSSSSQTKPRRPLGTAARVKRAGASRQR